MIKALITKTRSYRRFEESYSITREELEDLVDCARLSASAGNRQPLKYLLANTAELNSKIFPHLAWAGYLKDWDGPSSGERPSAYIVILGDTQVHPSFDCDHGIAAQSIMVAATEKGLGGCMIGSIKRDALRGELGIPEHLEILLVLALGLPVEKVQLEEVEPGGDIRYWRDNQSVHHVPKRRRQDIIVELQGT